MYSSCQYDQGDQLSLPSIRLYSRALHYQMYSKTRTMFQNLLVEF